MIDCERRQQLVALNPNLAILPPRDRWLMAYMTGRCHSATIRAWAEQAEALSRTVDGRIHLLLFVDTPATIGARGRATTTAFVDAMNGRISSIVMVLTANGLWRAMFRSAVAAGLVLSKRDYPISVVADIGEAKTKFAARGVALDMASAASALEVMRLAVKSLR